MRMWNKVLGLACGGALAGILAGAALDPAMKPPPDPPWKVAGALAIAPYRIVEAGPSDLVAPNWYDGPVDLSVPRYEPYANALDYVEPAPLPTPVIEEDTPMPIQAADPTLVVAVEAEAAAEDARAAEAASAPIPLAPEIRPALTEDVSVL